MENQMHILRYRNTVIRKYSKIETSQPDSPERISYLSGFQSLIYIYIYIVIHRQTVSFYQNFSVWLDTQDARSRNRNPSNFTIDHTATSELRWLRQFYIYI